MVIKNIKKNKFKNAINRKLLKYSISILLFVVYFRYNIMFNESLKDKIGNFIIDENNP